MDTGPVADAAELRRALVRFLVEASLEDTQQAKIADELLKAVRSVPEQGAASAQRLERRIVELEGAITRLTGQVEQLTGARTVAAAPVRGLPETRPAAAAARPGFLGLFAGSILTGVIAAVVATLLIIRLAPGMIVRPADPPVQAVDPAPVPQPAAPSAAIVPPPVEVPAPATPPPAPAPVRPGTPAWQDLWARALQQPVSACPQGGRGGTLHACLCAARSEDACTLAAAQGAEGAPVMIVQALLRAHNPPLISGARGSIDGQLGGATLSALVRLTHGCGRVSKAATRLSTEWKASHGSLDPRAALEPILKGLENEPQCLDDSP